MKGKISRFDELLTWDGETEISATIIKILTQVNLLVESILLTGEDTFFTQEENRILLRIKATHSRSELIETINKVAKERHDISISNSSKEWLKGEREYVIRKLIIILLVIDEKMNLKRMYQAIIENRLIFKEFF